MTFSPIQYLAAVIALAASLMPAASVGQETASAVSGSVSVDTRGNGDLTVTGRVIDDETGLPVEGAVITLGGRTTSTGPGGTFRFNNVNLGAGNEATISAPGVMPQTREVVPEPGELAVDLDDARLPPTTISPVVERVSTEMKGLLLSGLGLEPVVSAKVNWNGNTPGRLEFEVDGRLIGTVSGSNHVTGIPSLYQLTVDVDSDLAPTLDPARNIVSVVAVAQESGRESAPGELQIPVIPFPEGLEAKIGPLNIEVFEEQKYGIRFVHVGADFELAQENQSATLPLIGNLEFDWGANASFDYIPLTGDWNLSAGTNAEGVKEGEDFSARGNRPGGVAPYRPPKGRFFLGDTDFEVEVGGQASGIASLQEGFVIDRVEFSAFGNTTTEIGRFSLLDIFGPGSTTAISRLVRRAAQEDGPTSGGRALRNLSIGIFLNAGLGGEGTILLDPEFMVEEAEFSGTLGVYGGYDGQILGGLASAQVTVGTQATATFGLPAPLFREINFQVYGKYEFQVWIFGSSGEAVWVDYHFPGGPGGSQPLGAPLPQRGISLLGDDAGEMTWAPIDRPWRLAGEERFVYGTAGGAGTASAPETGEPEEAESNPGDSFPAAVIATEPLPAQVDFPLLENVYPDSQPALAASGDDLMLLYVRDTGAADPHQFTEVAWSFFDGTDWTVPNAIESDPRGQFQPVVAFDGNGNAVAVWGRVKDAGFAGTTPQEMSAELELVSARWDGTTETWGTVTALTSNAFLDHKPALAGPMSDGDLLLTWHENQANLLLGSSEAGEATRILGRRWDSATATWGSVEEILAGVSDELSTSFTGLGDTAAFALTRDLDGDFDDLTDGELFYLVWDEVAGTWGPLTRLTTDSLQDRNVNLAIDSSGAIYAIWQRGDDLVMDVNFSGTPVVVRGDANGFGFSDIALTVGPAGNIVAIWSEMTEYGSDAFYRVYDPASATWGFDSFLSRDSDQERSFATAWDTAGNLALAYNNVEVTRERESVDVGGGEIIEIDGVPTFGRTDLLFATRRLIKDLTIPEEGFRVSSRRTLPGDEVEFRCTVRNSGDLAIEDVEVAFFDGDPDDGGTLIETVTIDGWFRASEETEVVTTWTVPGPAIARTVFVRVDPGGLVSEYAEDDNTRSEPINGTDLRLEFVSAQPLKDGSARVVARVTSLSAPDSPVAVLALQSEDGSVTLAERAVSQLEPASSIAVPFDLPAGSHPEGERRYRLILDENGDTGDFNPGNNEVGFAMSLWVDEDEDGLPRYWEEANGLSDADPNDGNGNRDQDPYTDREEYRAGTDPRDASSALKVGEIAQRPVENGGGVQVSWGSVEGRRYRLERSYDLLTWDTIGDMIEASAPLNTFIDEQDPPSGRVFYQLILLD